MLTPSITPMSMRSALDKEQQDKGLSTDPNRRIIRAASATMNIWLGKGWLSQRLASHEFFNPKPLGLERDPFMRQAAISHLAELLLNMQHVEGVEHVVARISRGQRIVDDVAELAGAALLQRAGINYKFVRPTGKKRADYDVEAVLGGQRVCFEMKGKVAEPSSRTIVATLRGAADQLPMDTPNVVFIQPRDDWVVRDDGFSAMEAGVAEFFRKSDRVARVIIHADEWRTVQQQGVEGVGGIVNRRCLVHIHPSPAVPFPAAVTNTRWLEETGRHWLGLDEIMATPERLRHLQEMKASFQQQIRAEREAKKSRAN
jgi:hypothetical protein